MPITERLQLDQARETTFRAVDPLFRAVTPFFRAVDAHYRAIALERAIKITFEQ